MKTTTSCTAVSLFLMMVLVMACATPNGGSVSADWGNTPSTTEPLETKVSKKDGPPPHAPAHGFRAKHSYRYYRNEYAYYDTQRNLYFYLDGGDWRIAASLPSSITLSNNYVTVALETDKPYEHFEEHKQKYPPGQMKKSKNNKDKKGAKKY